MGGGDYGVGGSVVGGGVLEGVGLWVVVIMVLEVVGLVVVVLLVALVVVGSLVVALVVVRLVVGSVVVVRLVLLVEVVGFGVGGGFNVELNRGPNPTALRGLALWIKQTNQHDHEGVFILKSKLFFKRLKKLFSDSVFFNQTPL